MPADTFIILKTDPHQAQALEQYLQQHGFASSGCFSSPAEALRQVQQVSPGYFITDSRLGDGGGYEVVRRVRQLSQAECVISVADDDDGQEAITTNLSGYVVAERGFSEVLTCLRAIRQGRRYISPDLEAWIRHPNRPPALARLSDRERSVLQLLAEGMDNEDIAHQLNICDTTVTSYFSTLRRKLGLNTVRQLVAFAGRHLPSK